MAFTNILLFISEIVTGIIVVHMGLPWWLRLGSIPGWEDLQEEEMATYSSILAWGIPWSEEPGGLQPIRSQRA